MNNDLLELKIKVKEQELREAKRERGKPLLDLVKSLIIAAFLLPFLLLCKV